MRVGNGIDVERDLSFGRSMRITLCNLEPA